MNEIEARPIRGTEGTITSPFLSPDGQWAGYWSRPDQQLKKFAISVGAPVTLCDATNPFGASWGADDTILFGQPEGIMRVSANGGNPELLVATEEGEQVHGPQMLPEGESVLFTITTATGASRWDEAQIVVQLLDSGERKVLWTGGSDARYVPTGHLVYALEDVLFAIPFDLGAGGMGKVYKAKDLKLGRDVAIKVLPEEFSQDKERLARFEREAKLLAQLNHSNIATSMGSKNTKAQLTFDVIRGDS